MVTFSCIILMQTEENTLNIWARYLIVNVKWTWALKLYTAKNKLCAIYIRN